MLALQLAGWGFKYSYFTANLWSKVPYTPFCNITPRAINILQFSQLFSKNWYLKRLQPYSADSHRIYNIFAVVKRVLWRVSVHWWRVDGQSDVGGELGWCRLNWSSIDDNFCLSSSIYKQQAHVVNAATHSTHALHCQPANKRSNHRLRLQHIMAKKIPRKAKTL